MGAVAVILACCEHKNRTKWGQTKAGTPRLRCKDCGKIFTESTDLLGGMRIGLDTAAKVIELLAEGMSVNGTVRITGVSKHTILELLSYLGGLCESYMAENIKDIFADSIQIDEIWGYVFCKAATAKREKYVGGCGDAYCFTAIERTTKLLVCWHMGRRNEDHTDKFIAKLDRATFGRFHVSSDGWKSYPQLIKDYLGHRVDHGVMTKVYGRPINYPISAYSPARIIGAYRTPMHGDVYQQDKICTSHMERMNGSIRLFCKRMNRLTYAFSKKWDNHRSALAVFFMHYNYCRKHSALKRMTPATAHGLTTEVWSARKMIEAVTNT